jgi:magnesium transporter
MTVRGRLFDADGVDTAYDVLERGLVDGDERRLVWIDVDTRSDADLGPLGQRILLSAGLVQGLGRPTGAPLVQQYPDRVHLSIVSLEPDRDTEVVDIVAGQDWVLTVHDGTLPAIERILGGIEGETRLGALDAGEFVAAIVDSIIFGYYAAIEDLDKDIDALDEAALDRRPSEDVLARIVDMRRRIGRVRRILAPHREAFGVLERPDMALHDELGRPWPALLARFEGTMDSVDRLREALLGTYDIYMGRAAQRDSQVMKALTILSAILLPSVVLAGLMGMNFKLAFFDSAENFWIVIGAMVALAVMILGIARARA